MERPSHLYFSLPHSHSGRLVRLSIAVSVPALVLLGLTYGMGSSTIRDFGPLQFVPDRDVPKPPKLLPPEAPKLDQPQVIKPVVPQITIESPRDAGSVTTTTVVVPPSKPVSPPQTGDSRGPVAVAATHTTPPYPLLAQRQGLEGKVGLRLSILADGRVGKAEVATSSGSTLLDDAAASWITAHWLYKPALKDGEAVPGTASATVTFNLKDVR